jgi:hypothetical protein
VSTLADPTRPPPPPPAPAPAPPPRRRELRRRHRAAAHGTKPIDRFNRASLTILGLVLAATGTLGLLANTDTLSWQPPADTYRDLARNAADHSEAWTASAVASGLVLVVLGLWWAWKQIAPRTEGGRLHTAVIARTPQGTTTLEPAALAKAAAADLARLDDVTRARVRLAALDPAPQVIAWLDLRIDTDITTIQTLVDQPLARLAHAVDSPVLDCDLRLRFTTDQAPRVR